MHVAPARASRPRVLEFFAGVGLARLGLERAGLEVVWSNDIEPSKRAMYAGHFGGADGHTYHLGDIGAIAGADLPSDVDVAWASSPCTDLSLAGARAGLAGAQSGTFWHFVRILHELGGERPPVVVLENVNGLANSRGGADIAAAIRAFNRLGYSVDVLSIDARRFLPQSRPRLFLVGAQDPPEGVAPAASELRPDWLRAVHADPTLRTHRAPLPSPPAPMLAGLGELMDDLADDDPRWWDDARVALFAASLSAVQRERIAAMRSSAGGHYRTAYRRTRGGVATWEVRPDDVSGCLRTARGGSSKQAVVKLGDTRMQVRWMTPREYARLMGAHDYELGDTSATQALFGFGDAVAVPVVAWLAEHYLMPLTRAARPLATSAP